MHGYRPLPRRCAWSLLVQTVVNSSLAAPAACALVFGLLCAAGCAGGDSDKERAVKQAEAGYVEDGTKTAIRQAISRFDANGFAPQEDLDKTQSVLTSFPPERVLTVLEELYRTSREPLSRAQIMWGLLDVQQAGGDALPEERVRALAEKGLLDPDPQVAMSALQLLSCGWGNDQRVLGLVESRIATAENPYLLKDLFGFALLRGNHLLLRELKAPPPQEEKARAAWRQRLKVAMDSCHLDPDRAPPELQEHLVGLIRAHPELAEGAAMCLVTLRAHKSVAILDQERLRLPTEAQDAVAAALALLDPGEARIEALKARMFLSRSNWEGPKDFAQFMSRYNWLCYVAAKTRNHSLCTWLVDLARPFASQPREMLLDRFMQNTLNLCYLQLLGLQRLTDEELLAFFRDEPDQVSIVETSIKCYKGQAATPVGLNDELGRIGARLRPLLKKASE